MDKQQVRQQTAQQVLSLWKKGKEYLSQPLWGGKSLYERVEINNQFYEGEQWPDNSGDLPMFNICKQIGQAQISVIGSNSLTARYSWEGVGDEENVPATAGELARYFGHLPDGRPDDAELRAAAALMNRYFRTVSDRTRLDIRVKEVIEDAYKFGCGVLYFYWNEDHGAAGELEVEPVEIIRVFFGDPSIPQVQKQPYILLESRRPLQEVRTQAEIDGLSGEEIASLRADNPPSGEEDGKTTVLVKFWKEGDRVYAVKTCGGVLLRDRWDIGIPYYPIALMRYERKRGTIYAHTPLTEIIPNQRVANTLRYNQVLQDSYSAQPILVYDSSRISEVTNEIGGRIPVTGNISDSIRYLQGANMAASSENLANIFIQDTMDVSNVNAALRGNMNPYNTSAIIALRDAAKMPLQMHTANLYDMFEDIARIIGSFILAFYGDRVLCIEEKGRVYYIPFQADRYRNAALTARVDVGESALWSETAAVRTLDNLLASGVITPRQYLERMPNGYVPGRRELLDELEEDIPDPIIS